MAMMERPAVSLLADGGKYWEHKYEDFFLKVYVPANDLDGQTNNYSLGALTAYIRRRGRPWKRQLTLPIRVG